jgi:hypothetical protein
LLFKLVKITNKFDLMAAIFKRPARETGNYYLQNDE